MIPAREATCGDGRSRPTGERSPTGAITCAPAVSASSSIQSLRLIVGYKFLACLLADTQLTDHIAVAVRIIRLEIIQ
jgi:hypothetical protein